MKISIDFSIVTFFVFFISSCLGSFFRLVVDRYNTNESIVFKSSYCPSCKKNLRWWQNIPILSFIFLSGKCFYCKSKININSLYTELLTAIAGTAVFATSYLYNNSLEDIFVNLFLIMILILLSTFDLKHRIIPHTITYSGIVFIIIFQLIFKRNGLTPFFNLGIALLMMDFLYVFSSVLKRFNIDENMISISLIAWSIFFFFNQSLYFLIFPVFLYFISLKIKVFSKFKILSWLILFIIFSVQIFKLLFIEKDLNKIFLYLSSTGIIYFICEIFTYLLGTLLLKRISKKSLNSDISREIQPKITIGGGDITVFALISVFFDYKIGFLTLFIASLLGIISHFIIRALKSFKKSSHGQVSQYIPFVPYLSVACFIIMITINGR